MEYLRNHCDTSKLGMSIGEIIKCLTEIGMHCMPIKIPLDIIATMPLPAILFWEQRHFVVLYKIGSDYHIVDPAKGKRKVSQEDFCRQWLSGEKLGVAIIAEPTETFKSAQFPRDTSPERLWNMLKATFIKHRAMFIKVVILTLLCMVADLFAPIMMQRTIDDGIANKDIALIWLLVLGQLTIAMGNFVSGNLTQLVLTKLGFKININMMNDYLGRLIIMPMSRFSRKVSSDLIQKADDQNRIKNFLVSMPETIFSTFITLIIYSSLLIYYHPGIFIVFITLSLFGLAWTLMFMRIRREMDYSLMAA